MPPEQINQMLTEIQPSIVASLKEELKKRVTEDMNYSCGEQIRKFTSEWIKENVLPELATQLIESKAGLIALGVKLAPIMMDELTKALTASMAENLKQSWNRRQLFEKLFA